MAMYLSKGRGPLVVEVQLGSGVGANVGSHDGLELGSLEGLLERMSVG